MEPVQEENPLRGGCCCECPSTIYEARRWTFEGRRRSNIVSHTAHVAFNIRVIIYGAMVLRHSNLECEMTESVDPGVS